LIRDLDNLGIASVKYDIKYELLSYTKRHFDETKEYNIIVEWNSKHPQHIIKEVKGEVIETEAGEYLSISIEYIFRNYDELHLDAVLGTDTEYSDIRTFIEIIHSDGIATDKLNTEEFTEEFEKTGSINAAALKVFSDDYL